jgi:hypothetical protein
MTFQIKENTWVTLKWVGFSWTNSGSARQLDFGFLRIQWFK